MRSDIIDKINDTKKTKFKNENNNDILEIKMLEKFKNGQQIRSNVIDKINDTKKTKINDEIETKIKNEIETKIKNEIYNEILEINKSITKTEIIEKFKNLKIKKCEKDDDLLRSQLNFIIQEKIKQAIDSDDEDDENIHVVSKYKTQPSYCFLKGMLEEIIQNNFFVCKKGKEKVSKPKIASVVIKDIIDNNTIKFNIHHNVHSSEFVAKTVMENALDNGLLHAVTSE